MEAIHNPKRGSGPGTKDRPNRDDCAEREWRVRAGEGGRGEGAIIYLINQKRCDVSGENPSKFTRCRYQHSETLAATKKLKLGEGQQGDEIWSMKWMFASMGGQDQEPKFEGISLRVNQVNRNERTNERLHFWSPIRLDMTRRILK